MSDTPATTRTDIVNVTSENFNDFVNDKLGTPVDAIEEVETPEAIAAKELAELEAKQAEADAKEAAKAAEPKEGDIDGSKVYFKGKWVNKHDFAYRLHVQTEAKSKEADDKVAAAAAEAKTAKDALAAAEQRAKELQDKYEPPKSLDLGPEPTPDQFRDPIEYGKALKDWAIENTRREESAKIEAERVTAAWKAKQEAVVKEIPDYKEKIESSPVKVSDQMRDAILESDIGPKILYHLADNPDVAEALGQMTVGKMLRELGKLEATLGSTEKPATKSAEAAPKTPLAEISAAPAPITPLKGANSPVANLSGSDDVPNGMSYEQWKARRQAGKIK